MFITILTIGHSQTKFSFRSSARDGRITMELCQGVNLTEIDFKYLRILHIDRSWAWWLNQIGKWTFNVIVGVHSCFSLSDQELYSFSSLDAVEIFCVYWFYADVVSWSIPILVELIENFLMKFIDFSIDSKFLRSISHRTGDCWHWSDFIWKFVIFFRLLISIFSLFSLQHCLPLMAYVKFSIHIKLRYLNIRIGHASSIPTFVTFSIRWVPGK